jgi:hypothetical protein
LFTASIATINFVGAAVAVGWPLAFHAYGGAWLKALFGSLIIGLGFGGVIVGGIFAFAGIEHLWLALNSKLRFVLKTCGFALLVIGICYVVGGAAYNQTRKRFPLSGNGRADEKVVQQSVAQQDQILSQASESANAAIAILDKNAIEISQLRADLVKTLATFEEQRRAAAGIVTTAHRLEDQKTDLDYRVEQLRAYLSGGEPITRSDFAASTRSGLWQGFLLGLITSVIGTYAYNWIERRRQRSSGS